MGVGRYDVIFPFSMFYFSRINRIFKEMNKRIHVEHKYHYLELSRFLLPNQDGTIFWAPDGKGEEDNIHPPY